MPHMWNMVLYVYVQTRCFSLGSITVFVLIFIFSQPLYVKNADCNSLIFLPGLSELHIFKENNVFNML